METLRRYVFPVFWMLILGLIALALVKMAFFPSGADATAEDPLTPTAEFDQYATVAVEPGDLSSQLELAAMVQPDEGTELKATTDGEINKIWRKNGEHVDQGERVLQVRYEITPEIVDVPLPTDPSIAPDGGEPGTGQDGSGAGSDAYGAEGDPGAGAAQPAPQDPSAGAEPEYRYVTLVSTEAGTLEDMSVTEGDALAKGDVVATLSPGTYSIVADLTPEQQLSLLDVELEATATLPSSQDPVPCSAPSISEDDEVEESEQPAPDQAAEEIDPFTGEPLTSGGSKVSAAQLVCPVPADAKVVPGLSVDMTVDLGSRTDVLTVPTTAVEGEGTAGTVYTLDEETGEPAPLEVTLGLRGDGLVEVTDGLEEGQEILEFAPGVDAPDEMDGGEVW